LGKGKKRGGEKAPSKKRGGCSLSARKKRKGATSANKREKSGKGTGGGGVPSKSPAFNRKKTGTFVGCMGEETDGKRRKGLHLSLAGNGADLSNKKRTYVMPASREGGSTKKNGGLSKIWEESSITGRYVSKEERVGNRSARMRKQTKKGKEKFAILRGKRKRRFFKGRGETRWKSPGHVTTQKKGTPFPFFLWGGKVHDDPSPRKGKETRLPPPRMARGKNNLGGRKS